MSDLYLGIISQLEGETLESYCKPERCELYYTKTGSVPTEFLAQVDGANWLRERKLGGKLPLLRRVEDWKWAAYLSAEYARRLVQQEMYEDDEAERDANAGNSQSSDNGRNMQPVRGGIKEQIKNSDSGAFARAAEEDNEEQ